MQQIKMTSINWLFHAFHKNRTALNNNIFNDNTNNLFVSKKSRFYLYKIIKLIRILDLAFLKWFHFILNTLYKYKC